MEPRQSLILYVRTSDKVLLRFPDLDTARAWLEARRLSLDDEYLATDQTWRPLNRLLRMDLPPPGPARDQRPAPTRPPEAAGPPPPSPAPDPEQAPTVPIVPADLARPEVESKAPAAGEGPTRVSARVEAVRPKRPAEPARIRRIEPESAWESDLWGSEPDAGKRHGRRRRVATLSAVAGLVVIAGAVAWFLFGQSTREAPDTPAVARTEPAVAAPVAVPAPRPPVDPRSGVPEANPVAPSSAIPADPGPSADTGPPPAPAQPAPPAVAEPPAPAPEPPAVPEKQPVSRAVAAPSPPAPSPAVDRTSDDLNYDQHMAEGVRLLGRDPKKALAHFQAAARLRPASVEPKVKTAECEFRLGRYREAAALFQQAMDASPNYGPAIVGLARAHARLGNAKDARFLYLKYLDVNPNGSQAAEARAYLGR